MSAVTVRGDWEADMGIETGGQHEIPRANMRIEEVGQLSTVCRISPELFKHDLSDECCSLLTDVAQRLRQY